MKTSNVAEWKAGIEAFKLKTNEAIIEMIKKIALEIYKKVLFRTPVDKGLLRNAWTVSLGTPSDTNSQKMKLLYGKDIKAPGTAATAFNEGKAVISAMQAIDTIWFSNSMPYVETVEFGGYPDPVKRGTWVPASKGRSGRIRKGTGQWVIKSAGGFSKQAPQGMLGISILEVVNWIKSESARINSGATS